MSSEHFKFVLEKLDKRTILEQLAEEGSELSKASLKTIRAEELSNNFTPVTKEEAFSNCKLLTELVFPSKLVSIDARAFFRCESLSKIKLSKAIKWLYSWIYEV